MNQAWCRNSGIGFEDQQKNTISCVDISCANGEHLQVYNREPVSTDHAALGRVNYIHVEWVYRENACFENKWDLEVWIGNHEHWRIDFEREGFLIPLCNHTNYSVIYHWNYQGFNDTVIWLVARDAWGML